MTQQGEKFSLWHIFFKRESSSDITVSESKIFSHDPYCDQIGLFDWTKSGQHALLLYSHISALLLLVFKMNSDWSIKCDPDWSMPFFENPPETLTFTLINDWVEKIFCYGFCRSRCRS